MKMNMKNRKEKKKKKISSDKPEVLSRSSNEHSGNFIITSSRFECITYADELCRNE
jgi:hypothetical protein